MDFSDGIFVKVLVWCLNLNGLVGDMEGGKVSKSRGGSGFDIETLQRAYRIVIAEKPQMQSGI